MKRDGRKIGRMIGHLLVSLFLSNPTIAAENSQVAKKGGSVTQQMKQLQAQIQELKDMEEIRQLKYAYFRGIDTADIKLLAGLMHPDVTVHFIGGGYEWKLAGREQYLQAIADNFNNQVVAQHNGHHPEIKILSSTEAEGIWYLYDNFYNLREHLYTHGTAFYHDRYEKVDGKWLLKTTAYKRNYEIVEKMETLPNLTVHYLGTHGKVIP